MILLRYEMTQDSGTKDLEPACVFSLIAVDGSLSVSDNIHKITGEIGRLMENRDALVANMPGVKITAEARFNEDSGFAGMALKFILPLRKDAATEAAGQDIKKMMGDLIMKFRRWGAVADATIDLFFIDNEVLFARTRENNLQDYTAPNLPKGGGGAIAAKGVLHSAMKL